MYVRPHARKAGVGRRLVEAVIEFARQRVEVIQLAVVRDSARARRLYARLGFLEYGVERNSLKQGEQYYDVILMAMDLAPQLCARHSSPSERLVVAGDHRSSDDSLRGEGQ
jgi:ribosomal protein S18 acetylase RimI-like enzyme